MRIAMGVPGDLIWHKVLISEIVLVVYNRTEPCRTGEKCSSPVTG